jgi:hypothetical protein
LIDIKLSLATSFYSHFLCVVVNVLFNFVIDKALDIIRFNLINPMEITRFELVTSCLQGRRSPN